MSNVYVFLAVCAWIKCGFSVDIKSLAQYTFTQNSEMCELVAVNGYSLWSPYATALLRKLLFAKVCDSFDRISEI